MPSYDLVCDIMFDAESDDDADDKVRQMRGVFTAAAAQLPGFEFAPVSLYLEGDTDNAIVDY